jgi:hypothetical protein
MKLIVAVVASLLLPVAATSQQAEVTGCGILSNDGGCLHLLMLGGESYQLYETYHWSAGDTVFVTGFTDPRTAVTCQEAETVLWAYVGPCGIEEYGCGVLVDCGEDPGQCACLRTSAGHLIDLNTLGGFTLGDSVQVTGNPICCAYTWCAYDSMTYVSSIAACDSIVGVKLSSWGRLKAIFR